MRKLFRLRVSALFHFLFLISLLGRSKDSFSQAQSDTCNLQISLLTCTPGEELYSLFGHSAMRVTDASSGMDIIFNYGTFNFNDPNFYSEFVRGKLLYFLSVETYNEFAYSYQLEQRGIIEQVLHLTCGEKQKLFRALQINAQENNRYYKYDFLFDNCTTRLRDIVKAESAQQVQFKNILPRNPPTFRNLIHSYLNKGGQYWSKFGIDVLLGIRLDKKVTNEQAMFLPDYLLKGFDSAVIDQFTLVQSKRTILGQNNNPQDKASFRPEFAFLLLLLAIGALHFVKSKWASQILGFFDFLFYFLLGLLGVLILFMWFGTDHVACRDNMNLLWALPTHLPIAFVLHRNKKWIRKYFQFIFWLTLLFVIAWFLLPQELNIAVAPLLLLIVIRSYSLGKINTYGGRKAAGNR